MPETTDVRDGFPKTTSPIKAIRLRCLDCCAGSYTEVDKCGAAKCPLHPFRFGRNPYRKPKTPEQIEAARERMKKIQAARAESS